MELVTWLLLAVVTLAVYLFWTFYSERSKHRQIPGPTGLRCLKTCIDGARKNQLHHVAYKWAERYGDLVRVSVLNQSVVYINDSSLVRRVFNDPRLKEMTNDRPSTFIGKYAIFGDKNVAFNPRTELQHRRRKIFHTILKFYGDNVSRLEDILKKSLKRLTEEIQGQNAVNFSEEISRCTLRILDTLLAGEDSTNTEKIWSTLGDFDTAFSQLFTIDNDNILKPFPFLRFIPGLSLKRKYDDLMAAREKLLKNYFYNLKDTYVHGKERGIVDHLLKSQLQFLDKGDTELIDDEVIQALLCETTIGAYLTTSRTVSILVLLLIYQPKTQAKLHEEIDFVIGDETPSLRHRSRMPYTEAAIIEVLRYSSAAPFLLPHYTREDIEVNGYEIKKGTVLMANAWYAHRREDQWENPWTFEPERFLDSDGSLLQADHPKRKNIFPFGSGYRACPGESFGRSRMFLMVTTLLKHFEFYTLDGVQLPSSDPRDWPPGAVIAPEYFKCGARSRDQKQN